MITAYIRNARKEMLAGGVSLKRFMELRYDIMSRECPHGTFSVEQCSLDFFEKAYNHIMQIEPLPVGSKERPLSEYDRNYINWIRQAQSEKS